MIAILALCEIILKAFLRSSSKTFSSGTFTLLKCNVIMYITQIIYQDRKLLVPVVCFDAKIDLNWFMGCCKTFPENQDAICLQIWLQFSVIKLFCLSRQKAEIFSIFLKKNFMKLHKISNQSNNHGNKNCLKNLNKFTFCEVSQSSFQTDVENFSFLSCKTK